MSAQVPPDSWYGTLLKGVFNFSPATTWLEAIAWVAYVVPVLTIFITTVRRHDARSESIAPRGVTEGAQ